MVEWKDYLDAGLFPVIDQGQNMIIAFTNDASSLNPNDEYILFGDHTRFVKYYNGCFAQGADGLKILKVNSGIVPRYFFFAFQNIEVPTRGYSRHWSIAKSLLIPIPSFEEQNRIVGILDTFTDSIENLKQQIAQRRKQFEFYRDQLLDLEGKEGVEMKTLGEIGKCCAGATPSTKIKAYWDGGIIPWMSSGEIHQGIVKYTSNFITQLGYNNSSTKMLPINTVVIALAGQGKTRGTVAITNIDLCTNQSLCGVIINRCDILNKYIYYYLKTRYQDLRRVSSGDGTRGGLNLKMIASYKFPYIPLSEQQRIVSILDTFEASISNLEAQLAQRQKQYEYYRNRLLSFGNGDGES